VSVHHTTSHGTMLKGSIPKALSCSQLPSAAGFPLSFSLKVLEQQADGRTMHSCQAMMVLTVWLNMHNSLLYYCTAFYCSA
jgi:hypothetical protein